MTGDPLVDKLIWKAAMICEKANFSIDSLPFGEFQEQSIDPTLLRAEWSKVRSELVSMFRKELKLPGYDEDSSFLNLEFQWVNAPAIPRNLRVVFADPGDEIIKSVLAGLLKEDKSIFVKGTYTTRARSIAAGDLKREFLENGKLNSLAVYSAFLVILEEDPKLRREATSLGARLYAEDTPIARTENRVAAVTKWQIAERSYLTRKFWRLKIDLKTAGKSSTENFWDLSTLVQIGEQQRGQSLKQITTIGSVEDLPEFASTATVPTKDGGQLLTSGQFVAADGTRILDAESLDSSLAKMNDLLLAATLTRISNEPTSSGPSVRNPRPHFRHWTSRTGRTSGPAAFVRHDGTSVVFKRESGAFAKASLADLSKYDVQWIHRFSQINRERFANAEIETAH